MSVDKMIKVGFDKVGHIVSIEETALSVTESYNGVLTRDKHGNIAVFVKPDVPVVTVLRQCLQLAEQIADIVQTNGR